MHSAICIRPLKFVEEQSAKAAPAGRPYRRRKLVKHRPKTAEEAAKQPP
jgi:hypothetical protein